MIKSRLVGRRLLEKKELFQRFKPDIELKLKLEKPKVLVVDDEPHILRLLEFTLRKNFEVLTAHTPNEAIYRARLSKPSIILSDIQMPNMNGEELCNELQKFKETKNIPFMFLTALHSDGDRLQTLKTDAVDYLTKPFEPQELIAKLDSHIH